MLGHLRRMGERHRYGRNGGHSGRVHGIMDVMERVCRQVLSGDSDVQRLEGCGDRW